MAQKALQAAGGRLEKAVEKQVYSTMEKGGLPAEILQGMTQGTQSFMVPQRVEAPRNEMKLYSPAEEAALNLQRGQGRGEGFLSDLRKAGVKDEELEYTGLKDFLAGKQNVSKKEIQDYLAENKVQLGEVQLGHRTRSYEGLTNQIDELQNKIISAQEDFQNSGYLFREIRDDKMLNELPFDWQLKYDKIVNMKEMLEKLENQRYDLPKGEPTRHSQWTLPGGENYREILLTLPSDSMTTDQIAQKLFGKQMRFLSEAEKDEVVQESRRLFENRTDYRSSHWDQPNVLAHLRVNDRVDADGKKMLLIEEIQSDWHQAGREKGYASKSGQLPAGWEVVEVPKYGYRGGPQIGTEFMVFDRSKTQVGFASPTREGAIANATGSSSLGVPDAPFKEDWYQLALKRALQEAVDKGYDRVGITTGKRQIDRYTDALRANVDAIEYEPFKTDSGEIRYEVVGVKNGNPVVELDDLSYKDLQKKVGKEIAEKIRANAGESLAADRPMRPDWMRLSADNLSIGGEGMKKYYDEIYPGFLNKYGKKFDAKVGDTALQTKGEWPFPIEIASDGKQYWLRSKDPSRSDAATVDVSKRFDSYGDADKARDKLYAGFDEPVRYIDITPKMKEALSKGQPMFKEGGLVSSDAISTQSSSSDDPFRSGRPLRQRSRRPATQEENEALNRAVLQGAANMPYNLVGAPADIGNLLLTPLGLGSEQPVLSSDWIKQKMTDLGVRPEMPTDPTQRGLYSAADIGSSLVNPAAPMRAIASGAERAGAAIGRDLAPKAGEMVEDLLRKQGLLLDAAPTGKSPQTVSIYHGGNTGLEEIKGGVGPGNIFGGIFGSQDRRVAASHGDGSVYRIDVPKDEILSQQMLDSMDQVELTGALKKAMPWLKKEDVDDAFRAVIEDKAHKVNDDSLMRIFREDSPGEAGWEAQRIRGEVARLLGKKAVEMADEHGVSYLILPGAKPILDVDKKAEGGLVSNTDTIKARLIEQGMPEDKAFMQALKLANEVQMAKGGLAGLKNLPAAAKAAKTVKPVEILSPEQSQANLQRLLEESAIKQRLFHGTTASEGGKGEEAIKTLKPSKEGALGSGAYLTPAPDYAGGYAEGAGGNVLPVYVQMKNPLILEGKGDPMVEALIKLGMDQEKASRVVERAYENKGYIGKEVESRARAAGYDGLMQYRDGTLSEVVSYNPNAIKSAIGNRGTYDITSPELSKAKGGLAGLKNLPAAARAAKSRYAEEAAAAARASPRSKQEIESIAQRIAEQTQPGFVRPDPAFSVNPERKSLAVYELEQRTPMIVESTIEDKPIPTVDYEKQLGSVIVGVPGDPTMGQVKSPGSLYEPTRAGKRLMQVGDVTPETPVELYGGPSYGTTQPESYWASSKGAAQGIKNLVDEMAEKYQTDKILGQYMKMSPESSRYAMHNLDALISVLKPDKLPADKMEILNKMVREGDKANKYPQFVGFEDPIDLLLQAQMNPNLRKRISEVLEKPTTAKAVGFPFQGSVVQTAITEPGLRNLETGVTGYSVGQMRPQGELTLSRHPTYEYDIPGQLMGRSKYPIPYELAFPDFSQWFREHPELAKKVDPFNMLKSVGARQKVDPQYVDEIKMYEEAMKRLTGKKKGGKVTGLSALNRK
jgi:hypothetical protein